jgi:hypothetical protein
LDQGGLLMIERRDPSTPEERVMEGPEAQGVRRRRRRTIGFLMCAVAAAGLACALVRPFTVTPPPSEVVLGVSFDLVKTKGPDGRALQGFQPRLWVTKQAVQATQ